jgi:hypothetical protein
MVSTHYIRHVHLKDLTYMINIKQILEFVTGMLDSIKVQKANVHVQTMKQFPNKPKHVTLYKQTV